MPRTLRRSISSCGVVVVEKAGMALRDGFHFFAGFFEALRDILQIRLRLAGTGNNIALNHVGIASARNVLSQVLKLDEIICLTAQFVRDHRRIGAHGGASAGGDQAGHRS